MEPGEELPQLKEAPLSGSGISVDATDATDTDMNVFAGTKSLSKGEAKLKRKALFTVLIPVAVILLLLISGLSIVLSTSQEPEQNSALRQQPTNQIDTSRLPTIPFEVAAAEEATEVVFNNTVVANGALVLSPALQPTESVLGQIYYDQNTDEVRVFNGEGYSALLESEVGRQLCYVGEDCGFATLADIPAVPTIPDFPDIPDFPEQVELPQDLAVTATPTFAGLNLSSELEVSEGGTGVSSFANNTLLIGNGTGAVGTTNSAISGQLVVADTNGVPQFRSISGDVSLTANGVVSLSNNSVAADELVDTGVTAGTFGDTNSFPIVTVDDDGRITAISSQVAPGGTGSVASVNGLSGALLVQGTTNQINVISAGSTITLSTPQDLAMTSSPTFNGLTVTSITRGGDTITDFTGSGLQVTAGQLETTIGNSIDSSEIVDGTIQAVDIESTNIVGVSEDGYILSFDDTTNGFTWIDPSTLSNSYVAGNGLSLTTNSFSVNAPTCAGTDKLQWNGTAFVCSADVDTDTDTDTDTTYTAGTNLDLTGTVFSVINDPTFSGLVTANGGVTIQVGDALTVNGEAFTDLTGTGLQFNAGLLETTLGLSIQDAEVDDNLTVSAAGSVADGALSSNVSLLGSSIDLTSEIVGTLSVSNGGTGATTAAAARTNLGLGTLSVLNSVTTAQLANDTILAVDFDNTVAPGATEDGYVLTYDDATGGFTWISQGAVVGGGGGDTTPDTIADDGTITLGVETTGTFDSTPDTIADDGVISDAEAADDLTISASGSVADGALSVNVSLLGSSIDLSSEVTGTLSVADGGTGATTAALARTNLGLGSVAVLNSINTTNITNDTILAVDLDNTAAPGATEDGYVLTYDDASGGFTWVSASSIVGGGGGDSTPDTIADDNVIDLTSEVTGTLPIGSGGTGLTTFAAGDLVYASALNTLSGLSIGTNNQCLIISGGAPTWGSCTAGGGGFTNLTLTADSGSSETINDTDTIDIAGGSNIDTLIGATDTVTVNLSSAPTITGLLSLTSAGTALNVTNDATIGGDLTLSGDLIIGSTTLSETDLDALDDGTITLGTETTGTFDSTPDTIADDGVISDAEAADDLTISGSGSVADGALSSNVSLLGGSIQDAEVDDDLTVSAAGTVADGALSSNVSLLGSSIDLTSEIVGTLSVADGGTGATTAAAARTNLGLGTVAVLNSITTTQLTNDSILAVDFDNTVAPGATEDGYVLTYDDATGGFTWISQGAVVGGGGGDITPDTIADDGVISDAEAADDLTISGAGSVADGALSSNVSLLGGSIQDAEVDDNLTVSAAGSVADGALSVNVSLLGSSIQDGEVDDDLTISSSGSVDDGALSVNVSLLGSSIDLATEITGTLAVANGGTGATTATQARTNLGLGSVAILNNISTTEITNDTILAVDLDNTTAPGAGQDGYVLTYDDATGGFTWISQGAVVGGGGGDTTPDTIADDGSISLTTEVGGTLPVGSGGTGLTTFAAGDLVYASALDTLSGIGVGTNNQCLIVSGGLPTWGSCSAGGGGFTNLTLTADSGSSETLNDTDTIDIAGGTNINTSVGATDTVTVNLDSSPTIAGVLSLTGAGTSLDVTNNVTIGGTLTVGTTVFTEADLDALDDGVIALGSETSGTFDSTPDTIADDGVISDAEAADDLTISGSGSVADGALSSNVSLLGSDIQDGEVDDNLTVSAAGSVADGALSSNVSLLGSSIDLATEITGTLTVSNGGTGATTAAGARSNLGLGTVALLNSVSTSEITNDSLLAVDLDNTVAPGASEDDYVLTYDDATGGFTWISQGAVVGGGGGDTTADTIADDGVISDAEAADDLTISGAGSVADGALSANVSLLGSSIDLTGEIVGTLAVADGGTGATTAAAARTNLGLGTVAVLNSITTIEIANDSILAVDFDNTVAPGLSEDGYVLTYDDATGGFTWVSQGSIVSGGGGDTTPDTIADDGVILDAEAADDLTISGSGSVADGALSVNVSLLGSSIQDAEVDDDLTVSAAGTVADGALSANVSLLGSSIDLTSEIVGTLSVSNGGTGATTAAAARTNLGLGGLAVLNSVTSSEITDDSILAVDFTNTVAPGASEDDYVLTYDDATGGFTWISQGAVVGGGGGDTTADTIADDGVISDAEAADDLTISGAGSVADGALSANVSLLGSNIQNGEVDDNLTISALGTVADGALSSNVSLLGATIEDLEVSDAITISALGSVADGALSANVSLLGSSIDLTSEITGTLAVGNGGTGLTSFTTGDLVYASASNTLSTIAIGSNNQCLIISGGVPTWGSCAPAGGFFTNLTLSADSGSNETLDDTDTITIAGGTNITTSVGATDTVTVNLDSAPTITGLLSLTNAGTALNVTNNATIGGDLTVTNNLVVGTTTFSEADLDALDDGLITLGTETSGTFDSTPDTIADDGVISDAEAADDLTISASGSVADGALSSNVSLLGSDIQDGEVDDDLTISAGGSVADGALSANVSLLGSSIDLTSEITGTLAVGNGGTGVTSIATNGVVFGAGTSAVQTTVGTAGQVLLADALGVPTFTTLSGDVTVDSFGNTNLVTDSLGVNNGNGISGGGTITLGGSRTLSLGDLTADWVQQAGFDIVLDNAGSELRIREASGVFYGEIDVADITADRLYTFPDADGEVTLLGQTIENGELDNSSLTVTAGTGLNGGGSVALGGSVTLNSDLGTSIEGSEITDGTIEGADLEVVLAGTDDYILTFDSATGGFEWVSPGAVGVTLSEAEVEDFIFDADNTGTLESGTLALGSLSYTGVLTDTNVSDTLTVGASSTVDDGALSANVSLLGSAIALGSETTGNYVESITSGNGLQGSVAGVGSTPTLALGSLSEDWVQADAFDIVLNNSDSQLQILSDGGVYYGEFNVASLSADQTYDFDEGGTVVTSGNASTYATTGVTAGLGLVNGGTSGVVTLDVGAGTGLTVNADDIEVNYGSVAGTAVEGDTTITVNGGTGLSGGGLLTLGAGGTVTLNSDLGATIETGEITNDTILVEDLDNTIAPGAPEDTYVATYDNTSGGFTWVSQASVGGAGGVSSLNSLTGGLNIVGNSQIGVSPSGSDINLSISSGSIGATQLAATPVTASSYGSASSVGTFTVDTDGRLTNAASTPIAIGASQVTSGTLPVNRGGTGAATLTSGGVLFGNGTGAIQNSGVLTNGQLLIGDGSGAPSVAALTQGSGITVTNGAGSITIASTLGAAVDGSEITNGTIEAIDLESTNVAGAGTDDYLLSYDDTTGGFTYIDGSSVGTTLTESQVEAFIFDGDNAGETLNSGTLALNSLSYTGNLTVAEGGTGLTAAGAAGGVYYSTGTAFANNGAGTAGQCLLSNGAGAPTWGNCGGSGAGAVTLQVAYGQGNIITTTNNRNIGFTLANTTTDSDFVVNIASSSTSEIAFQNNGTSLFRVDSGGIDLLDVDVADFSGATVTFDTGEILETEINQNSLDDSEIQDNSLSAGSLATNSVNADEIAANAVGTSEIATNGVDSDEIVANAVGSSELASTTVGSGSYGNASTVATFTVDADGRLTAAGSSAINATLGTSTSGSYVESLSAASLGGLTVTGGTGEGSTPTIALDQTQTLASNPGLAANQVIFGTTGLLFEGSTVNTAETLLTAANPTADRTITIPNASGTVAVSATGNIALNGSGQISFTGTLPVGSGGTGATTLAAGVLLGNGTGAITSTGTLSNGQLLIGDGSGAPSQATLTGGTGITVTNGAGTISIVNDLGTNIDSGEIVDNTVQEIDLEVTNAGTDNYVLTFDSTTDGFTWVDPGSLGTALTEAQVEDYIFDGDNGTKTLSSGRLALDSLTYTGDLNDGQINNTLTVGSGGTVAGAAITNGTVANAALTNSSVTVNSGNGLNNGGAVSLGGSLTLNLGPLTADWNQTGAFDVTLNNADSELRILESAGDTYYGTFDVANLGSNQTYTFNQGGTVVTSGNAATYATTGVTAGSGLTGGGTVGVLGLNVGAGAGITVNANDIAVNYGSTASTAVQGNTQITITAGTGITGGGSLTLGAGGSVTLNNQLGTNIDSGEIVNNTVQEIDLEITNAGTDNYILSFNSATGGFTWVDPAGAGASESTVESYIFDGDNTGTLSSGTLALNSLSYTGNLTTTNGGTGLTASGAAGGLFYSTGAAFANSGAGISGQCLLSNGSGAPSWGNCGGSGVGATTLQVAYDNGSVITTTNNRDITFNLADTITDSNFVVNLQGDNAQLFDVQTSGTSVLSVDGSGDVGIGDSTPSYKLDVNGTGRFTNDLLVDGNVDLGNLDTDTITFNGEIDSNVLPSADDTYNLGSSSARWQDLYLGPASLNIGTDANNGVLSYNTTNSEFNFNRDINLGGNLGIGLTNPNYALEVEGAARFRDANHQIRFYDTDSAADEWTISTVSNSGIGFYEDGTTNRFQIAAGGAATFSGSVAAADFTCSNCINAGALAANSVGTSEIATNGVAAAEIAANAVGSSELFNGGAWAITSTLNFTGNRVKVGTGGTQNLADGANDLWVTGDLEVDGSQSFSGDMSIAGTISNGASSRVFFGESINVASGTGYKPGGGSWASTSDSRLKKNIRSYDYGLDALRQINPVTYQYNGAGPNAPDDGVIYTGVIAQQMQSVLPDTISVDEDGYYQYESTEVLYTVINAVQELDLQVQSNSSRIAQAEAELSVLNSTTTNLTKRNLTVTERTTTGRLTVTGTATINNLKVTGTTELADLKVDRIITQGDVPTAVLGVSSGTDSAIILEGNDTAGFVEVQTGTAVSTGDQVTVTFNEAYDEEPRIAVTAKDAESASVRYFVETTAAGFTISFIDAPTENTDYSFDYIVIQ